MDIDIFGTNVTNKVSNQKMLYYATSNNLWLCTTWQNGETRKLYFSPKCCISAVPEFNQSLLDFFKLFDSRLALWLPKSCNQCVQLRAAGGLVQEKGSREHCRSWTVLHAQCTSGLSSGFPLSQDNAEELDRWGGKIKHSLISYFLSNTSAKIVIGYCMSRL